MLHRFFPILCPLCFRRRLALLALVLPVGLGASVQSDIESIIDQHYNRQGRAAIPGMLVGVWEGGQAVSVTQRGYGDLALDAGGQPGSGAVPIAFTDQMRIASLTKTFTVTRILQLAAEGQIDLDMPLSAFDGVGGISLDNLNMAPRFNSTNPLTIRHLANMTSSLADYSSTPGMIDGLVNDITTAYTQQQLLDFARGAAYTPSAWTYSNTNTLLLGMIVEAVTGNSLAEELQTHVIQRAGLSAATYYPSDNTFSGDYAHGYGPDEDGTYTDLSPAHPSLAAGSGGMVSSFEDLQLWAKIVATGKLPDGTSLLGESELAEMLQLERLDMVVADGPGPYYDAYGLGVGSIEDWIGHSGEFLGYQHIIMYDPLTDRTIVIMINIAGFEDGDHVPTELFIDMARYYASIPEPGAVALVLAVAGGALVLRGRRRK